MSKKNKRKLYNSKKNISKKIRTTTKKKKNLKSLSDTSKNSSNDSSDDLYDIEIEDNNTIDFEYDNISDSEDEHSEQNNISDKINIEKGAGNKVVKNSNEIFKELIKRQLPDAPPQWKLNINDMKRICKYIDTSIFDKNNCCIWNGYITNMNNSNKGTYVNFYFRNKKVALHRLLYSNFVAPLDSSEYLKFNCENKGVCCNINHYEKYKYSKNNVVAKKEYKQKEQKKDSKDVVIIGVDNPDNLIVDFD